jgi:hypothetical protein
MLARLALLLLALGLVGTLPWPRQQTVVIAGSPELLPDTDDDFLPDCVEWVVLTSATNPDTDGDQIPDFIEVVQGGSPRVPGGPLPTDQEMRLLVTGPVAGSGYNQTWLHLFVRLTEPTTQIQSFQAWVELPALPGVRIAFDFLGFGTPLFRTRNAGPAGYWIQLSVPMVTPSLLQNLLPCSIQVESLVGNRLVRSGVSLFDLAGSITTMVPFGGGRFAAQCIAPNPQGGGLSNRVCLLDLTEVGTGPAGTIYQITNAFCDDCPEVECAPTCPASIGWLITVPGGLGVIGN